MSVRDSLIAFEERIVAAFSAKQIRAPIHLSSTTQADKLIEIFKDVKPNDWVCSGWRSHFHCLLKGMPEETLHSEILAGHSMHVCSKEHRIICSSIVGGILPIACGLALGAKMRGSDEVIWVFVGDMTATTGLFHEFKQYCKGHDLPVHVVIENNDLSTDAPTKKVWGLAKGKVPVTRYRYKRTTPHVGVSQFIAF